MEHAISEVIKIFTTMLFILLLIGMTIMGKHLSDVNSFKQYVNTQIERNGGYTQTVKTNVEKMNKDSYNNLFFVYEPNSNTSKITQTVPFGEILNYEIHSTIPIPFTTSGVVKMPIAFKGQAVSRIRDTNDTSTSNPNMFNLSDGVSTKNYLDWPTGTKLVANTSAVTVAYIPVKPNTDYTVNSDWSKTSWISIFGYKQKTDNASYIYDGPTNKWIKPNTVGHKITNATTIKMPADVTYIRASIQVTSPSTVIVDAKPKLELGSTVTPFD